MSFGFSIGDFLTVFEHTNKLRKRFINAPAQFNALSEEYVLLRHPLMSFNHEWAFT